MLSNALYSTVQMYKCTTYLCIPIAPSHNTYVNTPWSGSGIDKLYPDRQCISSSQLNSCCPVLASRHCTCAYTETVDPARRPSIPQVRQGSVRFNLREEEPPPSPFPFFLYTYSMGSGFGRLKNAEHVRALHIQKKKQTEEKAKGRHCC